MQDAYEARKDGGWYKRRHKKDGKTYKKDDFVVNRRAARLSYWYHPTCEGCFTDDDQADNVIQKLNLWSYLKTPDTGVFRNKSFNNRSITYFPKYLAKNNNKHSPEALLKRYESHLRNAYLAENDDSDNYGLKGYLNEGPNWPDASWYMAHEYDEMYFPDISLFDGRPLNGVVSLGTLDNEWRGVELPKMDPFVSLQDLIVSKKKEKKEKKASQKQ